MKQRQPREQIHKVNKITTTLRMLGVDTESVNTMLDELPVALWVHDKDHKIVYGNRGFKEIFGACKEQTCHKCLMGKENVCSCCPSKTTMENDQHERCTFCKRGNSGYDLNIFHTPITNKDGQNFFLKSSLHIKDLNILAENHFPGTRNRAGAKNFLVMCASCKRVRDQNNNWVSVENHIIEFLKTRISHGRCPECVAVLYPTLNIQDQQVNVAGK